MTPFITGSYSYGTPTENSDVDIVMCLFPEDLDLLVEMSDMGKEPIRYGNLNIIATSNIRRYECWKDGTEQLKRLKPVTKEEAVKHFDTLFTKRGLPKSDKESGEFNDTRKSSG